MSDRSKPYQRKYCRFCNCWFADNKASIDSHERGATHLANVEKDLNQTRKNKLDLEAAERAFMAEMQRIEAAAMRAFEDDAKTNPFAQDEKQRVLEAKSKIVSFHAIK